MLVVMHFAATPLFFAKIGNTSVMKIERKQEKSILGVMETYHEIIKVLLW